jgi:hypothetical protein
MVCDAHLFILQIHGSTNGAGWWKEMVCLFSQHDRYRETFHRLGVQGVTEFSSE